MGLICLFVISSSAEANIVVFDNNASPNTGYFSDTGTSGQRIYDDFILNTVNTTFSTVSWTGVYASRNDVPDDFTIEIYDDNGNEPGNLVTAIAVGNSATQTQNGVLPIGAGYDIYEFEATVGNVELNRGEQYWISIVNNTSEGWAWLTDTSQGQIVFSPAGSSALFNIQSSMQFQMSHVPEPGTIQLLAIGLLPLIRRRRKPTA